MVVKIILIVALCGQQVRGFYTELSTNLKLTRISNVIYYIFNLNSNIFDDKLSNKMRLLTVNMTNSKASGNCKITESFLI